MESNEFDFISELEKPNFLPISEDDEVSADMQHAELRLKDQDIKDRQ